jgi:hypothetical protein
VFGTSTQTAHPVRPIIETTVRVAFVAGKHKA